MTERFPWFAARLLFETCVNGASVGDGLFEERIVLVHAASGIGPARQKAQRLGAAAAEEYRNEAGELVSLAFSEVLDVVQIDETSLGEGAEVYHHYLNASDVENVRQSLKTGSV